jgi:hypothetical protein
MSQCTPSKIIIKINYKKRKITQKKKKLKRKLPYDPVIPLLGIYPKECKSQYNRDSCTLMLIASLFAIAKL